MRLLESHRRPLLAVVLLAVLGVSLLAAWSLVQVRQVPITRAEEMLRRIRQETLSPSWGSAPATLWYLTQDPNGKPIGYVVRTRRLIHNMYTGWTLIHLGRALHTETWTLDPCATEGTYVAQILTRPVPEIQIVLSDAHVTITQHRSGRTVQATAREPTNYIPEGLMHRLIAEVAAAPAQARFCTVWNGVAIDRGAIVFAPITMTPHGERTVRVQSRLLNEAVDETYHVDVNGQVFRIDDNLTGTSTRLVDVRSLARWFPEVLNIQSELESPAPLPPDEAVPE